MSFDREHTKSALARLAGRGVFVGASSWKYPGWRGMLYDEQRYVWRGRFSETRFNDHCLAEYAEVFKTVCVDAAYYKFPDQRYLEKMVTAVPDDFLFGFKVTDEITIRRFTNLPRFGIRAGKPNGRFLDADLFADAFLKPCEPFRQRVGLLMFEFSKFFQADYEHGRDFAADLDRFFSRIPKGWPYGVEIRNRHFLKPEYFAVLQRHRVAHVFNSWADMPAVHEQMALDGSRTNPEVVAARFLLKPGRKVRGSGQLVPALRQDQGDKPRGPRCGCGPDQGGGLCRPGQKDVHLRQQPARREFPGNHRGNARRIRPERLNRPWDVTGKEADDPVNVFLQRLVRSLAVQPPDKG